MRDLSKMSLKQLERLADKLHDQAHESRGEKAREYGRQYSAAAREIFARKGLLGPGVLGTHG